MSIEELILLIPVLLLSLSIHEFSHGVVSYKLGDPTPKINGRLTINPLAHLDLMGTLVLIVTRRVGWAKPVPIDPRHYKRPRKGMMYVSLAGPGSNFALALIFSLIIRFLPRSLIYILSEELFIIVLNMLFMAVMINIGLGIFNLLPVPPLDGSKILRGLLPPEFDKFLAPLEGPMGMMLIVILAVSGLLMKILEPIIMFFSNILLAGVI